MAHFKEGSKHCQKDVSWLPHTKGGEKSNTGGKSAEMSYLQYMRSLWPSFAYASVCLGWRFLPVYDQGAHSTKLPHYLLLGLENLFSILGSYYDEDNKSVYQQLLPTEQCF